MPTDTLVQTINQGRAYSPACAHRCQLYRVEDVGGLVSLVQMLGTEKFGPCSKCGG
ncbi:hypothetical protein ACIRL3_15785 [Streptomyces sp. NPDC102384]|uniref:hypothetical protein n=1 Tax=Streptomyces sp. NPDC102384 TaxID=3366166 RepID=UPI003802F3A2